jgi:putative DNA primase/helicase
MRLNTDGESVMEDHDLVFDVSPLNGSATRLVVARRGVDEVFRDRLDTSRGASREKFARMIAKLIGTDAAELVARCHAELPRLADAADQEAAAQAAEAAAAAPCGQGQELTLAWPEPWPEPIKLGDVLNEVAATVRRYVVVSPEAVDAVALWCAWTYTYEHGRVAPMLAITSPTKRCGKSRLLELLAGVCCRAILACNLTSATTFRTIEAFRPLTLLVDEADAGLRDNEELRGIVNSGHYKSTAWVPRCVGDDHEVRLFGTFCPKAIAAIGKLPGTWEDRSIIVRMERKQKTDKVSPFTALEAESLAPLRSKLFTATDNEALKQALAGRPPEPPACLHDRAADNWGPLLTVADLAGGDWPRRGRTAAVALSTGRDADNDELPIRLLIDLRSIFAADGRDAIPTSELLDALCRIEDAPWATLTRGRPITPHRLGKLLGSFGVRPRHTRSGNTYSRADLLPVWERYVADANKKSPDTPDESFTPSHNDASPFEIMI